MEFADGFGSGVDLIRSATVTIPPVCRLSPHDGRHHASHRAKIINLFKFLHAGQPFNLRLGDIQYLYATCASPSTPWPSWWRGRWRWTRYSAICSDSSTTGGMRSKSSTGTATTTFCVWHKRLERDRCHLLKDCFRPRLFVPDDRDLRLIQ
jgi:hypothetical protein